MTLTHCQICGLEAQVSAQGLMGIKFACDRCGSYFFAPGFDLSTRKHQDDYAQTRTHMLGYISEQNSLGDVPVLEPDLFSWLRSQPPRSLTQRAQILLRKIGQRSTALGKEITFGHNGQIDHVFLNSTYSPDADSFAAVPAVLESQGYIKRSQSFGMYNWTVQGLLAFEALGAKTIGAGQAFVAMWFNPEMRSIYELGLSEGIRRAGYTPLRVDQHEHAGKIDDEIISQIRRSDFIIADFTGHRGGVYFEAGFAFGLGKRVIFTCREDAINDLHFDVRQYNTILWSQPEKLRDDLERRITAVIGDGPFRGR